MVRLLIVIAVAGACTRTSEKYCGLHPEDLAHCPPSDAPVDPRPPCMGDPDCPAATPHCLLEGGPLGVCVGCIDSSDCTEPGKASCDPDTRTCRSCVEHTDCASMACLPDGTCGTDDNVIYVDENGTDTGTCTVGARCKSIAYAYELVTATRFHIKLSGTITETVTLSTKRATLLADPTAKLVGIASPALKVQKTTVNIFDLEIACASAIGGLKSEMTSTSVLRNVYIHGCGLGIENKGGFLNISRSRITENTGGGISLDAASAFSITNTFIYRNGSPDSAKGGVSIAATVTGMNRFEHNTVADNQIKPAVTVAGGVTCTLTNFTEMANNIFSGNTPPNTLGCDPARSKSEADSATLRFKSTMPPYDYHLTSGSPAVDQIDNSALSEDFDGQFRPQGVRKDFGADELKP